MGGTPLPVAAQATPDPLARFAARLSEQAKAAKPPDAWYRFNLKGYEVTMLGHYERNEFRYEMDRQTDFVRYLYGYPQATYRAATAAPTCPNGACPP